MLEAGVHLLKTGEVKPMGDLIANVLGMPDAVGGDADAAIDIPGDGDGDGDEDGVGGEEGAGGGGSNGEGAEYRWQVDGGDAGWLDFDEGANATVESAYRNKQSEVP